MAAIIATERGTAWRTSTRLNKRIAFVTAACTGAVIAQLEEAAMTLRRLKLARGRPAGLRTLWPDVVTNVWESYNADAPERTRMCPAAPSPDAISRMDEALCWLLLVDRQTAIILWARALGISWRKLECRLGRSETAMRNQWRAAIVHIAAHCAVSRV
jgi:hypothetical protein